MAKVPREHVEAFIADVLSRPSSDCLEPLGSKTGQAIDRVSPHAGPSPRGGRTVAVVGKRGRMND